VSDEGKRYQLVVRTLGWSCATEIA